MPALIDVLTPAGLRTGQSLPRAEIHRLGLPHRAFHLYLFNSRNELLLQRRSFNTDHAQGALSISVAGHLDAGEHSALAVRREVEEELGLSAAGLQIDFLFSYYQAILLDGTYDDRQFNDIYVTRADLDLATVNFDRAEVTELMFVPFDTYRALVANPASDFNLFYSNELRDVEYFLSGWFVRS